MKYKVGDEVFVRCKIINVYPGSTVPYEVVRTKCNPGFAMPLYIIAGDEDIEDMSAEEAWEIAKKLKQMNKDELWEVFITNDEYLVLKYFTPQQAKAKIEAWEAEKEIKRGDEVVLKDDPNNDEYKFFVTYINKETGKIGGWSGFDGGVFSEIDIRYYKKNGRHIDIDGLLKQIGGSDA